MGQFGAVRAVVLLKQDNGIERDHMLFAHVHGVTLIEERMFSSFDRCLIYPGGSQDFPEPANTLLDLRERVPAQYPTLAPLAEYINKEAWNERDLMAMMRKCLGAARLVRREVDPAKVDHLAFVLEAAGVFSVGLAACVGTIFHQHLLTNNPVELDDGLKILIWGGRENYEHLDGLRKQYIEAKAGNTEDGGLTLPEWNQFLQLVRSFLAAPKLTFQVPQLLRHLAVDLISRNQNSLQTYGPADLMLLKLSMNAASYFAAAAGFPPDATARIKAAFHARMATLTGATTPSISAHPSAPPSAPPPAPLPVGPPNSPVAPSTPKKKVVDKRNKAEKMKSTQPPRLWQDLRGLEQACKLNSPQGGGKSISTKSRDVPIHPGPPGEGMKSTNCIYESYDSTQMHFSFPIDSILPLTTTRSPVRNAPP